MLNWNEIQKRAILFSKEWQNEYSEKAESQTFWNEFFNIFGISRRRVASFEFQVKGIANKGFIDLFWRGTLIVEHKSKGEDLDAAYFQAKGYLLGIKESELPKYVLVSDFAKMRLYDLDENQKHEFKLAELYKYIHLFDFIAGFKKHVIADEAPVNIEAALMMGKLHERLLKSGFHGHKLELFLVRLMFCMFADDTGVFLKDHFEYYLDTKTKGDGTDTGLYISEIFQVLNTAESERQTSMDEDLQKFPYVNGGLFEEQLRIPSFDSEMRTVLLECCHYDWSGVSPAIFGSLFQSAMDSKERHNLGAHYTSEKNIMKVIRPLFLDDLRIEFEASISSERKLRDLQKKIAKLTFLDPACGCGTFLIIAYRELRKLELDIWKVLRKLSGNSIQKTIDLELDRGIDVDSFFGIEISEFPARIAQVALWLVDHQMNTELSLELGLFYVRLPLKRTPHIVVGNSLQIDWNSVISKDKLNYVLGNPPFGGKQGRTEEQIKDLQLVFREKIDKSGTLDYVAGWYVKALEYIQGTHISVAFVSTNAISHGEQVSILWDYLLKNGAKILFAHRTFEWTSESKGTAAVFVIIIGFGLFDLPSKRLFEYTSPKSDPIEIKASNINPYLIDMPDILIPSRTKPICDVPKIFFGSMPNDNGNFLLTDIEKNDLMERDPEASAFIRPLVSAKEFLHGEKRWCIWLVDVHPEDIKNHPDIINRVENVKRYRLNSKRKSTMKLSAFPTLFGEIRQPNTDYIVIPRVSSETREYIPISFFSKNDIANDSCVIIPEATMYHFGVLTSAMHMAWVRQICGRLTGRFRYSNNIVYNNFPWPKEPNPQQIIKVENAVKELLGMRKKYENTPLGDLYNPILMPKELTLAHRKIDVAVDRCYRQKPFQTEVHRLRYLFNLYSTYTKKNISKELEDYFAHDD